ncbi:MAG: class I SAM-dependent methyltransferase [Planctomycetes bacterium]|nr:class I SAM-dependent methyltransferase [Planctomycetota bacterium]MCB9912487.1 class I SAM-dependent methyltransferase [Planctomycetota bacterium]
MDQEARERVMKALQAEALAQGDPTGWFEPLYQAAGRGDLQVPWDDGTPNPHLVQWLDRTAIDGRGLRALEVGCGMGHGARALAERGFHVTAVDLSHSAIDQARRRNAHERIAFQQGNMLEPPKEFLGAFDLVVEIYTLQAIPADQRAQLTRVLPTLLAPGGQLWVVCRARDEEVVPTGPPWALAESELRALAQPASDLELVTLDRFVDQEDPARDRFRALLRRP